MIDSLLDRPFNKVVIDRVIIEEEDQPSLLVQEEEEVLNAVKSHFKKQFRKRRSLEDEMPNIWKERYAPLKDVEIEWYDEMLEEVRLEEWEAALQQVKNKSAPGPTGISYPLIKNVKLATKAIFTSLATECIKSGSIPKKWKLGLLYPIPKREDWCYNFNNVRLILLLETF